jgi:hypothetical protein
LHFYAILQNVIAVAKATEHFHNLGVGGAPYRTVPDTVELSPNFGDGAAGQAAAVMG